MGGPRGVALWLASVVALLGGCSDEEGGGEDAEPAPAAAEGPAPEWPAPPDPQARTEAAGLQLEVREQLEVHRHAHLDVFFNGEEVVVPAGIGIAIDDPGVQAFDGPDGTGYGGIEVCEEPCISPLHTHDPDGIVHTESTDDDLSTLGQFFVEWDVRLDEDCVGDWCRPETEIAVYVDGEPYDGDPAGIPLEDQSQIDIVIGTPPDDLPADADFSRV